MIFVLGFITSDDDWREVCKVEAESADSPATRITDVTDDASTEVIVRWNMEHYPELASPRMIAADLGGKGTYSVEGAKTYRIHFGNMQNEERGVWPTSLLMQLDPACGEASMPVRAWVDDPRDEWMLDGPERQWFDSAAAIADHLAGGYGWAEFREEPPDSHVAK